MNESASKNGSSLEAPVKRRQVALLLALAIAGMALVVLAAGLPELQLEPGQPLPSWFSLPAGSVTPARGNPLPAASLFDLIWQVLVGLLFFVVLPLWLIVFILSPRARQRMLRQLPAYLLWAFIIYLLLQSLHRLNPPPANPGESGAASGAIPTPAITETLPTVPAFIAHPPEWLVLAASAAVLALLLGWPLFRWQRTHRQQPPPLQQLAQQAQSALDQLQAGGDLTDTILRCYAEMSRVISQDRGIHRQQAMTPREFEQHLAGLGLRDEHIGRLTRLFEGARYGAGPAGIPAEREAQACLAAIVQAYGRAA